MMLRTRSQGDWLTVLLRCGVADATAHRWAPAFANLMQGNVLSLGEAELDDFLGQVLHECGMLERLTENLNYRVSALTAKFGNRITPAQAQKYGRIENARGVVIQRADQEAIANIIYGGAWGLKRLGNKEPGDGWKYRGRGPIQVTGRYNYTEVGKAIGVDIVSNPDLLATDPNVGLAATIRWWERNLPDDVMDNLPEVTKRVNGGYTGIEERRTLTETARAALLAV